MPERIFDPAIHQDIEHLQGFKFRHGALYDRIQEIKKAPSAAVLEYKSEVGAKQVDSALLAEYVGVSESTLKKLKSGGIADPRGSTYWLLWRGFGIDPRDLLGIPRDTEHVHDATAYDGKHKAVLEEKDKRIAALEEQCRDAEQRLTNLRTIIHRDALALGKATAEAEALREKVSEKNKEITWRDGHIRRRNKIILALIGVLVALFVADLLVSGAGWFGFGLLG